MILVLPAVADTRFTAQRMGRNDLPRGRGECEIRLQVDNQVEVTIDGDRVFMHTLAGQDGRDDGSQCNVPMPGREVAGFDFQVVEKRGDIQLVEGPTRRNGGKAIVRIRDGQGGFGRYIFRLSWAMEGGGPPPVMAPPPPDRRPDVDRRGPDADRGRDLRIVSANWGAPGRGREVTRVLQDRMRDGRLRIKASNEDMGFDPAVGQVKALVVVYELRGRRQEVRVAEGDYLELP
jgi:hypothetical protein